MEVKLNKKGRLVVNAAAKDEVRPVLHCIHIRKGIVEAANGFVLVQRAIDYRGEEELLLDRDQVAGHKDNKELGGAVYVTKEDSNEVKVSGEETYVAQKQTGAFPKTDVLYPDQASVYQIGLGRSHLLTILKCLDKDEEVIKFTFYGAMLPVKFEVGKEVKGLIMPIYLGE